MSLHFLVWKILGDFYPLNLPKIIGVAVKIAVNFDPVQIHYILCTLKEAARGSLLFFVHEHISIFATNAICSVDSVESL